MADTDFNTVHAAIVNVVIKRGDAVVFTIPLYDPNNNNDPVDLSGYTRFLAQIKVDDGRETSLIELDSDSSPEIVQGGANDHELTFTITSTKSAVKKGIHTWDVEADGDTTLIEGSFEVSQDVTRIVTP